MASGSFSRRVVALFLPALFCELVESERDPKGLPIGTVAQVSPGSDLFLNIRLKPAADLNRLEEVLVVTQPGWATFTICSSESVKVR